jgi:hypothetical protein
MIVDFEKKLTVSTVAQQVSFGESNPRDHRPRPPVSALLDNADSHAE